MKFNAKGAMRSNPGFSLENRVSPVKLSSKVAGSVSAEIGAINIDISQIPVRMRIPFLKRRKRLTVIGTVGGVAVKVDPFTLSIKEMAVRVEGMLGGEKGISVHTDGKVTCATEMEASGTVVGKMGIGSVELGDDECDTEMAAQRKRRKR